MKFSKELIGRLKENDRPCKQLTYNEYACIEYLNKYRCLWLKMLWEKDFNERSDVRWVMERDYNAIFCIDPKWQPPAELIEDEKPSSLPVEPRTEAEGTLTASDTPNTVIEPLMAYETGAKRSDETGKGRFDLISPYGLKRLAVRYEEGVKHKGERNWEKGFPVSRAMSSAMRHINQYLAGDRSEDHLAGAAWQLFAAMHFEAKAGSLPETIFDTPRESANAK